MGPNVEAYAGAWDLFVPDERARLVRLCTALTGDSDAAEDLAQETLLEAWRHIDRLHDPNGRASWLAAIARNVCLRWARHRGHELAQRAPRTVEGDNTAGASDWPDGTGDLLADLEREDLARLLDRAMSLLPPATRRVLIESYVEESPQAEVAARLGLSEGAVAMRLQRGKLALRRALTTDLRDEAALYGVPTAEGSAWQETRIWCMGCGRRRLLGSFIPPDNDIVLRCPDCRFSGINLLHAGRDDLTLRDRTFKPALNRLMVWADRYYEHALTHGSVPCHRCGRPARIHLHLPDYVPPDVRHWRGCHIRCDSCGATSDAGLGALALWTPDGRRFWRAHPRLRTLPERAVEAQGRPAIVTCLESVSSGEQLAVVVDAETYRVLAVHDASSNPDIAEPTGRGNG